MITRNLSIISRYSRTYFERRLSEIHIGFNEQIIMMYLCKCDVVNQDTIAKHFMLDKGTIAKTLNKLEEKQFITRSDNPINKREKLISITQIGQSKIGYITNELMEWHNYLFEGITQDELDQFNRIVSKMAENAANVINGSKTEVKSSTEQEAKSSADQEAKSSAEQED